MNFILKCLLSSMMFIASTIYAESIELKENTMSQQANIQINAQSFALMFADNAAAQALQQLLPLQLKMQDHLQNEKFATLPQTLPNEDQAVRQIEAGDVMLYQGNILVIFYESFETPYRYTRIGKIAHPAALKAALGSSEVVVKIE